MFMKARWLNIAAAATALMFACQAGATDDAAAFKALAKKKGCFNCHGMDKPILGPSLRDIGKKYRNDASAQNRLSEVIKNGSKGGVWGDAAMPKYARLGDDDINLMVRYILSLK